MSALAVVEAARPAVPVAVDELLVRVARHEAAHAAAGECLGWHVVGMAAKRNGRALNAQTAIWSPPYSGTTDEHEQTAWLAEKIVKSVVVRIAPKYVPNADGLSITDLWNAVSYIRLAERPATALKLWRLGRAYTAWLVEQPAFLDAHERWTIRLLTLLREGVTLEREGHDRFQLQANIGGDPANHAHRPTVEVTTHYLAH